MQYVIEKLNERGQYVEIELLSCYYTQEALDRLNKLGAGHRLLKIIKEIPRPIQHVPGKFC